MLKQWAYVAAAVLIATSGCRQGEHEEVKVDGSSTVAPITMAAAEMFGESHPEIRVTVGVSGTGGGFKKFLDSNPDLRTDINDASRPIKESERQRAQELGIAYVEVPIGLDGIAVVVHPTNDFCDYLTTAELKHIWEPGSQVQSWKDVRDGFPDLEIKLYGPGTDSGTFDYFTEAIVGEEKASRSDFTMSEDDNVLVQGVNGDRGSLGYFGFAYYEANMDKLKLLAVDPGTGQKIKPSLETIRSGEYKPLSRPLFLYINSNSLDRAPVMTFLEFYIGNAPRIVEHEKVKYVALSQSLYDADMNRIKKRITGSPMASAGEGPVNLEMLYGSE
jgi:phosphate transport system substrate-binding protein